VGAKLLKSGTKSAVVLVITMHLRIRDFAGPRGLSTIISLGVVTTALLCGRVFAATTSILLPAASANQDGADGADGLRRVGRFQQCYGGSLFPQQPIVIRELRFRPSAAVGFAFSTTISNIQINLSTSSSQPESLSTTLANNLGPDAIAVFNGALTMSSAFTGPAGGPKDFDMVVPFTTPFTFDPTKGNLLVDIVNRSGSVASYIDNNGWAPSGDNCGRIWAYGVNPTTATVAADPGADIVRIVYDAPPLAPLPPSTATYDLARDFSTSNNPSGPWTFGYGNIGSTFVPFTFFTHDTAAPATVDVWAKPGGGYPAVEKNNSGVTGYSDGGQGTYLSGSVWFYPGLEGTAQNYGMIRFTTPAGGAGTYRVVSDVRSYLNGASSGDTDFHILKNGAELFGKFLGPNSATAYSNNVALASGDVIDFVVGRGADNRLFGSGLFINASLDLPGSTNTPPPPPVGTYDLARDFSTSNNPSGPWTFGYETAIGSALVPYTFFTHDTAGAATIDYWGKPGGNYSAIEKNNSSATGTSDGGQGVFPPGTVWYYPGFEGNIDNYGVVRFTVPGGGSYRLVTAVHSYLDGPSSGDTDFHILKNGTPLFEQFLAASSGTSYSNVVALAAGDKIDFVVGRGADGHLSGSGLKIAASLTLTTNSPPPPPASTYDLARDFSTSNNPSGPWTFGYETNIGSALVPYTFFTHDTAGPATVDVWAKPGGFYSAIEKNNSNVAGTSDGGQGVYPPGSVWYYPGLEGNLDNYSVVRFTTPASGGGTYQLLSSVHSYLDGPSSGDTDFHILKNGTPIFEQFLAASSGTSYSNVVALAAGDKIDFVVGRGADGHLSGSGLRIAASLNLLGTNTPPPPPPTGTYNLSQDFSTNNPSGAWTYGSENTLGGSFSVFPRYIREDDGGGLFYDIWTRATGNAHPAVYRNSSSVTGTSDGGQGVFPPGTVFVFPGEDANPDQFGIIRFTLPAGGTGNYRLGMAVQSYLNGPSSGDSDIHVLKNGTELFSQLLPGSSGTSYSNVVALAAGDTVDFAVGRGADGHLSGSGLKIAASLTLTTNSPPPPPPASTYDLARDFSTSNNPSGPWTFGYETSIGSALVPYTFFTHDTAGAATVDYWGKPGGFYSAIEKNNSNVAGTSDGGQGVYPPGSVWYYPGLEGNPDNYSVVRFTTPASGSGTYQLLSSVHSYLDGPSSGDTDFHIFKNGTPLFEQFLPGSSGTSYSNLVALTAGDKVDFIVGRGADGHLSGSGLKIAASLTLTTNSPPPPPPASTYDLARDFSTSNNPSGPWTFGYETALGGSVVPYTFFTHDTAGAATIDYWGKPGGNYSAIEKNNSSATGTSDGGQGVFPPGTVWYYPGYEGNIDNYGVVRLGPTD